MLAGLVKNRRLEMHPKGSCMTTIKQLSVRDRGLQILQDVSLTLPCGCFAALVGPNGAGKSTLIRSLIGEIKHTGTVHFNGKKELPRIGYVPQRMFFESDNPCTVLDLFQLSFSKWPIWFSNKKEMRAFTLRSLITVKSDRLIDRSLSALSGGELRRVFLALALADDPQILLLDEAGTGLDQNGQELFYELIASIRHSHDISILMVSHSFSLIKQYADYAYLLSAGILVDQGSPKEIFSRPPFVTLFG